MSNEARLHFIESIIMTEADDIKICDDQLIKTIDPSHQFTTDYVAQVIQAHFKDRGNIRLSRSSLDQWIADLEHHDYSSIQVGLIPFPVSYYNVSNDLNTGRDGVYVTLVYGTRDEVDVIAEEIAMNPEDEMWL